MPAALFNQDQIQNIIDMYQSGLSSWQISKKLDCSDTCILYHLKKNKIKIRKRVPYSCNDNYFKNIDTEEKAYILGFLFADGYNNGNSIIKIEICDKDVLEKIKKNLNFTGPIKKVNRRNKPGKQTYLLEIHSRKISKDLTNLGCIAKKSKVLKFPNYIKKNLVRHFIRGYVDGDGCIYTGLRNNKKRISIHITSTKEFLIKCQTYLFGYGGVSKHGSAFQWSTEGSVRANKVLKFLYKDANIYMDRKYNKYLKAIS